MQLPRGTFRSIRKGMRVREILDDLASLRFTGISTLSSASINGTLVFNGGICVLAKVQGQYGNPAWDTVTSNLELITDTALSDLDTTQMQLALDFNKKAGVYPTKSHGNRPVAAHATDTAQPSPEPAKHPDQTHAKQKERDFIKTTSAAPAMTPPLLEKTETRQQPSFPAAEAGSVERKQGDTDQSPAEKDLDTFDSMDLDDVAQKIRKDCKIILKQLQLDHLTEK